MEEKNAGIAGITPHTTPKAKRVLKKRNAGTALNTKKLKKSGKAVYIGITATTPPHCATKRRAGRLKTL